MRTKYPLETQSRLQEVSAIFAQWRSTCTPRSRIPEQLWQAAVDLAPLFSTHHIARTLRLNYTELIKMLLTVFTSTIKRRFPITCSLSVAFARLFKMRQHLNLYLSPHLDDAILSCGGLIYAQRQAGERVGVLSLCAGLPLPGTRSALARFYESAWSESTNGMVLRQAENAAVLSRWGVDNWECGTLDAIYRISEEAPFYQKRTDLLREPHIEDAASLLPVWEERVRRLGEGVMSLIIYAPLGVGNHVDHELARRLGQRMCEAGWRVWFYEDYPYVELEADGVQAALARFGTHQWTSQIVPIDVHAKIEALLGYHTQIGRVFGCEKDLVRRVKEFTAENACTLNCLERLRRRLAPSGRRLWVWRRFLGYHAHAERIWTWS